MMEIKELQSQVDWLQQSDKDFQKRAEKAYGYVVGGKHQWDNDIWDDLINDRRTPLSLNIVGPKINLLYGVQNMNATGWKGVGVGGEDDDVAMLVTALLMYENRNKKIFNISNRVFKDMITCGRGWFDLTAQKGEDFLGENVLRRELPSLVFPDPDSIEMDQSDMMSIARMKWYPLKRAKLMYPEKLKRIKKVSDLLDYEPMLKFITEGTDQSEHGGDYGTDDNIMAVKYYDDVRERIKIVEIWNKEYEKVWYAMSNGRVPDIMRIGNVSQSKAEKIIAEINQQLDGQDVSYGLQYKNEGVIYRDEFSGQVHLVEHEKEIYDHQQFPLVSAYGYSELVGDKNENYGIVFNMEPAQDEKNKRRSMAVDLISRSPKGGGFFKSRGKNAESVKRVSETGEWVGVNDPNDFKPHVNNANPALVAISSLEQAAERDSEELSGVNRSMMGIMQGSKESGVLARQRIAQGTTGVQELFEHLDISKRRVLKMMVSNIGQFWTPEKVMEVVGQVPGFEPDELTFAAVELLTNPEKTLKYDVLLDDGENSRTAKAANFASMIEAIQYGIPIPPAEVVETSPWANKRQIIEGLEQQQMQQQMAQMTQGKQN